ncbi:unnamed protein product [Rotaria sp. Silwood1]|nr:unnamed protein product [Rotaria sp. Silwood1]CAF3349186.1 unnamed protein product [Rotaria sp. Silwood1]CAF3376960.1 unnamed protein product [Rotaria sp. Silwood1]CAF4584226.1 unnamed protein product [Rotaria sp. Silwood1]CAF4597256.1 unnamed protein product [Rotaria sp. Silwood1]
MSSTVFFDPDKHHQPSPIDQNILFVRSSQCLSEAIISNDQFQQTIYLCCSDPSTKSKELQEISKNLLIHICKEHSSFESRLAQMKENKMNGSRTAALNDVKELKCMKRESLSTTRISIEADNQHNNTSLNISNEYALSEETK